MENKKTLFSYNSFRLLLTVFSVLALWRIVISYFFLSTYDINIQIWAATYQIIAWFGAITGILFSQAWGGYKSVIGRAALAFSIGLLAQSFGQSVFSYYFYTGLTAPYPSLADVGFFGSIPFYVYGMLMLAKASGVHFTLKSLQSKVYAIIVPVIILLLSYIMFLRGYTLDAQRPLQIFLDFGYPLGQAIYVSIAILAYLLSRKLLGGLMRIAILFFIVALIAQYISDYTFLYQSSRELFVGGGIVDVIYFVSYTVMAVSVIKLKATFDKIRNT